MMDGCQIEFIGGPWQRRRCHVLVLEELSVGQRVDIAQMMIPMIIRSGHEIS